MHAELPEENKPNSYCSDLVSTPHRDIPASIVVFLVALPLCMGIAIASGVPVAAGLITGMVGGLIVGWFSGSPLQVSGPAAGLTVIVYELVQRLGLEVLGVAVLLAGVIQVVAGLLRYGRWFRAVSPAVISGMLAGIGVLIFASQFHVMVDDTPKGNGVDNLMSIPEGVRKGLPFSSLGSVEQRRARRRLLLAFEEVHEQQVFLREQIGERLPHIERDGHGASTTTKAADIDRGKLQSMVQQQGKILNRLRSAMAEVREAALQDEREGTVLAAAQRAASRMQEVIDVLATGDAASIHKALAAAERALEHVFSTLKSHDWAAKVGMLTILLLIVWSSLVPKSWRIIPAPLVAVVGGTLFAAALSLPVIYVEVPDNLWNAIRSPSWTVIETMSWGPVLQAAVVIAVVASAETLLCAAAVDRMQPHVRTQYDRELVAQGLGNVVCGLLGALPMTGVIVRSSANVDAGARTRLSTILHGAWLLLFVVAAAFLLRLIPTAALAAILVYTGYKLVNWRVVPELARYGKGEVIVYFATLGTIVFTDLLSGVITGVVLAAGKLLLTFARLDVDLKLDPESHMARLGVNGAATFLRLPQLAEALESVPADFELHVDFEHLSYIDHACLDLFMNWARQHEGAGGRLVIDWDTLHSVMSAGAGTSPDDRPKHVAEGLALRQ